MFKKRSTQLGMFEADQLYLDFVGRDSFYGFLASERDNLFKDEDFADIYCPDNGRPCVPPSMLAIVLLLQTYDRVSDDEAIARVTYDIRWKVALGIEIDDRPFVKSTLQLFRAQLILKDRLLQIFQRSLEYARQSGYMKKRKIRAVLDTTNILGRGAVKDTYNLLADGIRQLIKSVVEMEGVEVKKWVEEHRVGRYFAPSIKGEADVDWDDERARQEFLRGIVVDAEHLLRISEEMLGGIPEEDEKSERVRNAGKLLIQLIRQDVDHTEKETKLKQGVARDRVISVHDPEMRHGRKSSKKRFDGHKASIAVDAESQLITAVEVLAGNAADNEGALDLVRASEENTGLDVEETIGDCAYGDGNTRKEFVDANRKLVAKVSSHRRGDQISKDEFEIDLDQMTCTCPAGQTTKRLVPQGYCRDKKGNRHQNQAFCFDANTCANCPLRLCCIKSKKGKSRTIRLHPQERFIQEARALQTSPAFDEYRKLRQVAEHRLARLVQLGIRQARYFGHKKTLFQLTMAATVANLTLVATKTGQMRPKNSHSTSFFSWIFPLTRIGCRHLYQYIQDFVCFGFRKPGFRLGF